MNTITGVPIVAAVPEGFVTLKMNVRLSTDMDLKPVNATDDIVVVLTVAVALANKIVLNKAVPVLRLSEVGKTVTAPPDATDAVVDHILHLLSELVVLKTDASTGG